MPKIVRKLFPTNYRDVPLSRYFGVLYNVG